MSTGHSGHRGDSAGASGSSAYGLLAPEVIEAIVAGRYTDVFSVLGLHGHGSGQRQITVFLPGALSVEAISPGSGDSLGTLEKLHGNGLFSALVNRSKRIPYRLRVTYPRATMDVDDPYRFPSLLDESDCYLFNNGTQEQAWRFLGANHRSCEDVPGVMFAVWAPNARRVSVVGDFNGWDGRVHIMRRHSVSGIWDIFLPGIAPGTPYKYEIIAGDGTLLPLKADPYARRMQLRPETASLVPSAEPWKWGDDEWMARRPGVDHHSEPIAIYEVHPGSWRRRADGSNDYLGYRELAHELVPYVRDMGFTHIQLMPVSEYPFDGSWGYQPLGMFAPTSRFGTPEDLCYFIDAAHRENIGVLLDWVSGHFPSDAHGLAWFDGTHLYEHADPRRGFHPDWNTLIYNYGRSEVGSYLVSNAFYWLKEYHIDGLRFDAVASMLYLDYSREPHQWSPNYHGGRENLEAIDFLRSVNSRAYFNFPGIMMVAEESTAWPGVTDYTENGGLGFGFKWNLGWMNDTLSYIARDPIHRRWHHNEMTFGLLYAFSENFILPLSHDEVVHGKHSILGRMPGDEWQKFANLRAYYCFMWTHPGKKLLFMGDEFAQRDEWSHDRSLDWHLLEHPPHQGVQQLVKDLNRLYRHCPALYQADYSPESFEWVEADNEADSLFVYLRKGLEEDSLAVVALNMTPTVHRDFRIGVPAPGFYLEAINSDSGIYQGSGQGNLGGVEAEPVPSHGRSWSIRVTLPPLAALILLRE